MYRLRNCCLFDFEELLALNLQNLVWLCLMFAIVLFKAKMKISSGQNADPAEYEIKSDFQALVGCISFFFQPVRDGTS